MLSKKLDGPKSALEAFYAKRLEDQQIHTSPEHQTEMNGLIDSADLALNEFATAIKPIRNAVVPWYMKLHLFQSMECTIIVGYILPCPWNQDPHLQNSGELRHLPSRRPSRRQSSLLWRLSLHQLKVRKLQRMKRNPEMTLVCLQFWKYDASSKYEVRNMVQTPWVWNKWPIGREATAVSRLAAA